MVVSGASRKNERWEHKEGETVSVEGKSEAEKLASDPMYRLEHGTKDRQKAEEAAPRIAKIIVSGQRLGYSSVWSMYCNIPHNYNFTIPGLEQNHIQLP